MCDSRGQGLWISRAADGAWINATTEDEPPKPDMLRSILWKYLQGRGTPPEEIRSLSLDELVERVCPSDPMGEYRQSAKAHGYVAVFAVIVVACIVVLLIDWLFDTHWFGG